MATVLAVIGGVLSAAVPVQAAEDVDLGSYVNPFIGTQDEGNTYPGATVPFGMVQFSPDTGHSTGYNYEHDHIRGFSLVHLSGAGCPIGGMVPMLPTTGAVESTDNAAYALGFDHATELASPGYYKIGLNSEAGEISAEVSATTRTGAARYTFPATTESNVLINAGQALASVSHSSVQIIDDQTVQTSTTAHGFCQDTEDFTVYTQTHFNRPFTASGTWTGDAVTAGSSSAESTDRTGAYLQFDTSTDAVVEAQTSLSYVDASGAAQNLTAESSTFDDTTATAASVWEERLGSVAVSTTDTTRLRPFYSALYRSFLAPNTGTDVDGRYVGWDQETHTTEDDFTYYQNFSLWDTYRTQQQLLALLAPSESADMALSLVRAGEQGWAPRWGYGPVETNIMTGDPITPFLVSAWSQGLLAGHEEEAYAVLKENADTVPPADSPSNGRVGNPTFIAEGYVPHIPGTSGKPGDYDLQHGGSATLEYAVADAMLSTMAAGLGYEEDAARYAARGNNYLAIYDSTTNAFRARGANGLFNPETDPANAPGFHEGTAVQYEWMVPQNMPGLVDLFGGPEATAERLDAFFAYDQLLIDPAGTARDVWVNGPYSYYNQDKYNPNNEPDLASAYAYLWAGQPWKTTDVVRAALTLFTDGPTGVTGNDDLGAMSAWAVMTSIGIYPAIPGSDVWALSTPVFPQVTLTLDPAYYPNETLEITASGVSDSEHYTQSLLVGGEPFDRGYLSGTELAGAGTLEYTVGSEPSPWATGEDAAPAAVITGDDSVHRLVVGSSLPSISIAEGGEASVPVQILAQGPGTVTGTIEVTGSSEVTATSAGDWSVPAEGATAQIDIPLDLAVAPGTPVGSYPVHVVARSDAGDESTFDLSVLVPQMSWLNHAFTDVGIGDRGAANANFDGLGYYYLRDALAAVGVVQGAELTLPGTELQYVLGPVPAGEPDHLVAKGQTTDVRGGLGTATTISLVGSGASGTQGGAITVNYVDGSTQTADVTLSDWCTSNPAPDNIVLPPAGERGDKKNTQSIRCGLFATAPIALAEGKSASSITWPDNSKMHVFAIASDATPATLTTSVTVNGTAAVGETVSAGDPDWGVEDATTTYQWALNGGDVPEATTSTYTIGADDAGKTLTVTVTGQASSYLPGSATSDGVLVAAGTISVDRAPTLAGDAKIGHTVTVDAGAYSPADVETTYQWTADGEPIAGATQGTLSVAASLFGKTISAIVTVSKHGYGTVNTPTASTAAVIADPTLTLPADELKPGESITLDGQAFAPGETVTVTLHSDPVELTTVAADANGAFNATVTIPSSASSGVHTVRAEGATSGAVASVELTVLGADVAGPGNGEGNGVDDPLASTGPAQNVWLLTMLGLLFAALGSASVLYSRRQRQA